MSQSAGEPAGPVPVEEPPPGEEQPPAPPGRAALIAAIAVTALVGYELGLLGGFLALSSPELLGVPIPVGILIAVIGNVALGIWVVRVTRIRLALAAPVIGWVLAAFPLSVSRREGDLVLTADHRASAFLLLGAAAWVVAVVAVGALDRRGRL